MSFLVKSKTAEDVLCEVVDAGELKSRRHLNVRGKSATLPSITGLVLILKLQGEPHIEVYALEIHLFY
jgi:hypothetical protein